MAYDSLTTTGINNLINSYIINEKNKRLSPLEGKKKSFQDLELAYNNISTKLTSLKSILSELKNTDGSAFNLKSAYSSNTNFASVTAASSAPLSSNSLRITQLAKSDLLISEDLNSEDNSAAIVAAGTHNFSITAGDGNGGQFISRVSVEFEESDFTEGVISNKSVMEKIQTALSSDKAIVQSDSVSGENLSSGSFILNLNGVETEITYEAGTYSDVLDNIVDQINEITGVSAEKVTEGSNYSLKVTVTDTSNYISISGDTGSLLSDISFSADKEKSASGLLNAAVFSPESQKSQLSLSAKNSGYDYRILSIQDESGSGLLSAVGLNLGSSRPDFVQSSETDTAGFIHSTSLLNAKFKFNEVNIERNSNSITDLISGMTLNLKSQMAETDTDVNISIETDTSAVKQKIQSFIEKFNDVYAYIKRNSVTTDGKRGALVGDITSSSLMSYFSSVAINPVSGISANQLNSLSKIGITFNSSTGLSLDSESTLESAITSNNTELQNLFNSNEGIASKLYSRVDSYMTSEGYLDKSKDSLSSSLTLVNDRITYETDRINKSAELLRKRYQQMQMQLASLLSNQSFFSFNSTTFFEQ